MKAGIVIYFFSFVFNLLIANLSVAAEYDYVSEQRIVQNVVNDNAYIAHAESTSKPVIMHTLPIYSLLKDPANESAHVIGSVQIFELEDFEQWIVKNTLEPVALNTNESGKTSRNLQINNQYGRTVGMSYHQAPSHSINTLSSFSGNTYRF